MYNNICHLETNSFKDVDAVTNHNTNYKKYTISKDILQ